MRVSFLAQSLFLKKETANRPASNKQHYITAKQYIKICCWKPFGQEIDNEQDCGSYLISTETKWMTDETFHIMSYF